MNGEWQNLIHIINNIYSTLNSSYIIAIVTQGLLILLTHMQALKSINDFKRAILDYS